MAKDDAVALADSIVDVKDRIRLCSRCFNITEADPCNICTDPERTNGICVVEEPLDVSPWSGPASWNVDTTCSMGRSHPSRDRPDQLKIRELLGRIDDERRPRSSSRRTSTSRGMRRRPIFIACCSEGINVTRPASGLPVGGDLEYADEQTLGRALRARRVL
jgi:recombination protein RecR